MFCFSITAINAQVLQDTASLNLVKNGIDCVYNMEFAKANDAYRKISQMYPEHPVVVLFRGIMTYWENYPVLPTSQEHSSFEKDMLKCIGICEKNKDRTNETEFLLANLCARGMLLSYYSNNNLSNEVFSVAKSTYKYIRRSFDMTSDYSDFYFFTGIYNYFREVYPRVHPVYKPLALLFRKGNRAEGLNQLQIAANNSILLRAESYSDLSYISINFENNYQKASYFSQYLHDLYPDNPEFLAEYIKNLLLIKRYDEAEDLVKSSGLHVSIPYLKAQLSIFNGILQEKKYHDNSLAKQYYTIGVKDISSFGSYGNEFAAYAYFGLSRISGLSGDKDAKKTYHKLAMKLSESKEITFDE